MAKQRLARYLGISNSTSTASMLVRSRDGHEDSVSIPMIGRTTWHGEPAFSHEGLPLLLLHCLTRLEDRGWVFRKQNGCLVIAIRQHDLTLADQDLNPLGPALTWESNAAELEAQALNEDPNVRGEVGTVAARFLTPKAQWLLKRQPGLRQHIRYLLTTADWMNGQLMGGNDVRLGTSDALSNSLLSQATKQIAMNTITIAHLDPLWVPQPIQSGQILGKVSISHKSCEAWLPVVERLSGWYVGSPLADNHSGAWGMSVFDSSRMVLSAGSSGTAVCVCESDQRTRRQAVIRHGKRPPPMQFEFFETHTLLLTMLPRACLAWDAFRQSLKPGLRDDYVTLNEMAQGALLSESLLPFIRSDSRKERFPNGWSKLTVAQQVGAVQFSIAAGLLTYAGDLLRAIRHAGEEPAECALTGGLSSSPFFQSVIQAGMGIIAPKCKVYVSSRTGPARFQAAARGAMMAAMLPDHNWDFAGIAQDMDAVQECQSFNRIRKKSLERRLAPILLRGTKR